MSHGETQHHWQLATRSVQGADGRIVMEAFDPEGEIPYYYEPGDLGRPNWAVLSQSGFGDRSAFYLWLDGIGQLPAPLSTRPLSPPPERSHFAGADGDQRFRQERARWFHDHGDGSELRGSLEEQHRLFDRLKDKLLRLRRNRANPSGTLQNKAGPGPSTSDDRRE